MQLVRNVNIHPLTRISRYKHWKRVLNVNSKISDIWFRTQEIVTLFSVPIHVEIYGSQQTGVVHLFQFLNHDISFQNLLQGSNITESQGSNISCQTDYVTPYESFGSNENCL